MVDKIRVLRRYTDLPSLFYMLSKRSLTLVSPKSWDDKNDSFYIDAYRRQKNLKSVLALCFTESGETYHHWRVFTSGNSGVCVEFDKALLTAAFTTAALRHGSVMYRRLDELRTTRPRLADYPFIKRQAFADESEFRVIYEDPKEKVDVIDVKIDFKAIVRVVVSPWMPRSLFAPIRTLIRKAHETTAIRPSTVVENEEWKAFVNLEPQPKQNPAGAPESRPTQTRE